MRRSPKFVPNVWQWSVPGVRACASRVVYTVPLLILVLEISPKSSLNARFLKRSLSSDSRALNRPRFVRARSYNTTTLSPAFLIRKPKARLQLQWHPSKSPSWAVG